MTRLVVRPYSVRQAAMLSQQGLHPVLARLLVARGVNDVKELSTGLNALIPPQALLQIDDAALFLADAIEAEQKLLVVADYDCDGATACAVAVRGLRSMGAQVDYLVPNRFEYGYGLTPEIVALAAQSKSPDIIITVDNGIASVEGVAAAQDLGIDVVVTDHHLPGDHLPAAAVIVNPNQPHCNFPSKNLAGVGVMFYVLMALRAELRLRGHFEAQNQPRLDKLLDLVALGTVADVVKLDANNRVLVAQGLQRIRTGHACAGINALFRVAGKETRQVTPMDLGFTVGPRLNAAGRLADMSIGIECLLTDDLGRAAEIASQLDNINRERRTIESEMQEAAMQTLENINPQASATLCLYNDQWHQGVIGIVASRLKEKYFRPTITFAPAGNGMIKGSGRSIPGFHLRDALDLVSKRAPDLIDKFGGHAMAAGLSLQEKDFEEFITIFEQVGKEWLTSSQLEHVLETDGELDISDFSLDFISLLETQVWGQGFAPPLFNGQFQVLNQKILKEKHLKLFLEKDGQQFDAIWFNRTEELPRKIQAAYRLDANEFNGRTKVQLLLEYAEAV